jgi:hypothetical protein
VPVFAMLAVAGAVPAFAVLTVLTVPPGAPAAVLGPATTRCNRCNRCNATGCATGPTLRATAAGPVTCAGVRIDALARSMGDPGRRPALFRETSARRGRLGEEDRGCPPRHDHVWWPRRKEDLRGSDLRAGQRGDGTWVAKVLRERGAEREHRPPGTREPVSARASTDPRSRRQRAQSARRSRRARPWAPSTGSASHERACGAWGSSQTDGCGRSLRACIPSSVRIRRGWGDPANPCVYQRVIIHMC